MEPKIASGDLIIAQRSNVVSDRDIIVCVYREMAMIKVYRKSEGQIFLESLNPKYAPLLVEEGDLYIEGVVKGVYSPV